jgi:hypothetical protein
MSYQPDFDENLRRLEEEIEKRRKKQCYEQMKPTTPYCGSSFCEAPNYVNAYDSQGMSCAKVLSSHIPNYQRHDDWDKAKIEMLQKEIQNLNAEKSRLILNNSELIVELRRVMEENSKLKAKREKKKDFDVKVYESVNGVGNTFKNLYNRFMTWLNT